MTRMDPWTERLSDYLDGDLRGEEREALEAHLPLCPHCRATLEALREVVARARRLEDRAPAADLWAGIAARIAAEGAPTPAPAPSAPGAIDLEARRRTRERRFSFTLPQLVAAGIALVLLSGGSVWLARPGARGSDPRVAVGDAALAPEPAARFTASFAGEQYDAAVADLERVLREERARLDPATIANLERNLAIVDQAIEDARRALAEDPASAYLNNHLAASMRRKLDLLRRATAIVRAQS